MKYELETIPVWDAIKADSECPLCLLKKKSEEGYIKFFLGNSVMVPEMRVKVNASGFCGHHYDQMLDGMNRHGLGLMVHTHSKEKIDQREKKVKALIAKGESRSKKPSLPLACGHKDPLVKQVDQYLNQLEENRDQCMVCSRIDATMKRYIYTILFLWKKDDQEFRQTLKESKGFCHQHLPEVFQMAPQLLSSSLYGAFAADLLGCQQDNWTRLEKEILWYTQKFDPQYHDKPWGTSKDAIYRVIQKLSGLFRKED